MGSNSGTKGIVFVRDGKSNEITHFIVLRGGKFTTGNTEWDLVVGFADGSDLTLPDTSLRELREELNDPNLAVERMVLLGTILTDAGMTSNNPGLSDSPINLDPHELAARVHVLHIGQLSELALQNEDGFFSAVVLRCILHGVLPNNVLIQVA